MFGFFSRLSNYRKIKAWFLEFYAREGRFGIAYLFYYVIETFFAFIGLSVCFIIIKKFWG